MKKEEADRFCEKCDRKKKKNQNGCLRENEETCMVCGDFYKCVDFCIMEKREENDKL